MRDLCIRPVHIQDKPCFRFEAPLVFPEIRSFFPVAVDKRAFQESWSSLWRISAKEW